VARGVRKRDSVVECASPLALLEGRVRLGEAIDSATIFGCRRKSGRGLPHSTTLAREPKRPQKGKATLSSARRGEALQTLSHHSDSRRGEDTAALPARRLSKAPRWDVGIVTIALLVLAVSLSAATNPFQSTIEADWAAQEKRLGRRPEQVESIRAALERSEKLLRNIPQTSKRNVASEATVLAELRGRAKGAESLEATQRLALYHEIRWAARELALKEQRITGAPIAFMKRNRFVCQMLHEYLGYFYDYGNVQPGGGVFVLEEPGRSFKTRDLIGDRLPPGNFATLAVTYDARTIYFAFAERAPKKPSFYSKDRRSFHLYALSADGRELKQLTHGVEDDFDPCPLPDGGVAFMSSRRGAFCRCNNPWEPIPTYTLHRMNADGSGLQTLSFHETNEWHPFVLNDGRIVYIRWDYVDRSAANFHGLWVTNPDGSSPVSLFGNYTMRINACYQPRAIPGSSRILFVAGAHHADVGGSLVIVDPARVKLDAKTGEDDFSSLEVLTPEVCFAEASGWPKSYFHSPWPLSEDQFLVSFSFDPLPGMSSGEKRDTHTGLYYFDRWGNLELLYRDDAASSMYPVPLAARRKPPVIPSTLHSDLGDEGEFVVGDVRRSLFAMPENRPIRELRVFQVLPKAETHIANDPRIGYANAESARMFLGSVPVEADGSAYFRAPARKPLYFQAVDERGRAVQTMRSVTYLQPGERRSCIGCHEGPNAAPASTATLATRRAASRLRPGPDGTHPLNFARLVQPILDRQCVRCHDGTEGAGKSKLGLSAEPTKNFTRSYDNLKRFVRWYEWGGASITQIATWPGRAGADESPLTKILDDATHAPLKLPDEDRRRIYLWLDANAPFYGTYEKSAHVAQRNGEAVPPPRMQ